MKCIKPHRVKCIRMVEKGAFAMDGIHCLVGIIMLSSYFIIMDLIHEE